MYMTLTGSDKDKVGRICQILPKVASECLKVPQSGSNRLKKCLKQAQTGRFAKTLKKGGRCAPSALQSRTLEMLIIAYP